MNLINIITIPEFEKDFKALYKKHPSLKSDFEKFLIELSENPLMGSSLGSNLYKSRINIKSKQKGKSGGARIIDYVVIKTDDNIEVYLLAIYDKSDYSTIDLANLKKIIKNIIQK